jgi:hypothetical protein
MGSGPKPRIQIPDALRFAHVYQVDGINAGVPGKAVHVVPPISAGTNQSMDKQHRPAASRMEIMDARASRFNKSFVAS